MATVFVVQYCPGEPDGVYTVCVCATRERAELELTKCYVEAGFDPDQLSIEEVNLLE